MELIGHTLTKHGRSRLSARRLSVTGLEGVFEFGREVHTRGAIIHVVGRNEVEYANRCAADISDLEGWHVVCSRDGHVITAYRNHDLRGLRPRSRTRSDRYSRNKSSGTHGYLGRGTALNLD
jgi:hypothetical protein